MHGSWSVASSTRQHLSHLLAAASGAWHAPLSEDTEQSCSSASLLRGNNLLHGIQPNLASDLRQFCMPCRPAGQEPVALQ